MMTRRTALGVIASAFVPGTSARRRPGARLLQSAASKPRPCPPIAERLPAAPRVVNVAAMGRQPGRYGGVVRTLIGSQKDIRLMTIYGYARLVGFDEKLNLQPDILESFEAVEDRDLHLQDSRRPQMVGRQPAHAGGFPLLLGRRLLNEDLTPGGPATALAGRRQAAALRDRRSS